MGVNIVQFEGGIADWHPAAIIQEDREERPRHGERHAPGNRAEQDDPAKIGADQFRDGDRSGRGRQEGVADSEACHQGQAKRHGRLEPLMGHGQDQRRKNDEGDIKEDGRRGQKSDAGNLPLIGLEAGCVGQLRGKRIEGARSLKNGAKQSAEADHGGDEAERAAHPAGQGGKGLLWRHSSGQRAEYADQQQCGECIQPCAQDEHEQGGNTESGCEQRPVNGEGFAQLHARPVAFVRIRTKVS